MRRDRYYSIVVVILAAALAVLLSASKGHAQASQDECAQAHKLLTKDSYDKARNEYNALIPPPPDNSERQTTKDGPEAPDCAAAGLKLVAIFTLADLGQHEKARELLTAFIEEHPETRVPEDLKYLYGGKWGLWNRIKAWAGPWLLPLAEILATFAIILLAYVALRRRVWPWVRNLFLCQRMPFLDVQDFDSEAESLKGGKGFAMMVEEQIGRIGGPDEPLRPGIVSAPATPPEVPASLLPTPYLKILSQLISWIVPQRIVTLSGYLLAPGDQGSGLTLTLTESWTGKVIGNQTIWEQDYGTPLPAGESPNPESYYGLAEAAAIWASSSINERYSSRGQSYD